MLWLIGSALGLGGLWVAASRETVPVPELRPILARVGTTVVDPRESYEVEERFLGRIEAARSSRLGFELPGTLQSIAAEEGLTVETGTVLASLDVTRLQARRVELAAVLTEAQAGAALAEATLNRLEQLTGTGAVSRQERDQAIQKRDAALAALDRIGAQMEAVEVDLAKSRLVAPFSGQVARRYLDEGTIVRAGEPVIELIEAGRWEARVGVSPRAALGLRPATPVLVRVGDGGTMAARVSSLVRRRDPETRAVSVRLEITDPIETVREGDLVELSTARTVEASGSWLPRAALTEGDRGLWAVYVAGGVGEAESGEGAGYRLERRHVEVLHLAGDRAFVRGALQRGERVVTEGLHRLVPGQRVEVLETRPGERS